MSDFKKKLDQTTFWVRIFQILFLMKKITKIKLIKVIFKRF